VEESLKILAAALRKGTEAGLDRNEVFRLRTVAILARSYKEDFADYLNYCELEARLNELEKRFKERDKRKKS